MADFWKRNGFTVKEDEEKDRENNNLSFWARYGMTDKEPESTLPSRSSAEPAEDSFLGRLAQRGVTIDLTAPKKSAVTQPAETDTSARSAALAKANPAYQAAMQYQQRTRQNEIDEKEARRKQLTASRAELYNQLMDDRRLYQESPTLVQNLEERERQIERMDAELGRLDEELKTAQSELDEQTRQTSLDSYAAIPYKADFAQKSKARELTVKERVDDPLYAYVNGDKASASLLMDANDVLHGKDTLVVEQMTPDEVRTFNYLHATEGKDAAEEYVEFLRPELNARNMEAVTKQIANFTGQNLGTKILGSVGSVAMSPLRGLAYAGQFADYVTTGKVDPNAPYNMYSAIPTAARETVSKDIERKWGTWGSFAYQTGMSMADFLLNSAVAGGSEALSLTIMGTGAAADATISAKERGLDDTQSFVIGTIAGLAEAVSEKVSFEKLFKQADWRKQPVKYILQNFFFEGAEEVESDAMNWLADAIVARDKSEWQADIDAYKAENPNATDSEAFWDAVKQRAIEGGMDFLGGAISGGLMASGRVAFDRAANRAQRSQDKSQAIEAVREARQARTPAPVSAQQAAQTQESTEGRIPLPTADDLMSADDASGEDSVIRMGAEPEPGLKTDEQLETEKRIANARNITEATGIKYGVDEKTIRKAERYGRLTGDTVEFYLEEGKNGTKQNGFYDPTNRRIYYNVNATKPFEFTFGHEFTHTTENTDAYRTLSELVEQRIMESGRDITEEVQKIIDRYRRAGITLTEEQARQEIVADWIGENLSDERTIREISRDKASVAKQIRDGLDSFITRAADMSGIITSYEEQKYRNIVGLYDKYLGRIEEARVRQAETEAEPVQSAKERNRERLNALSENWSGIKKGDLGRSVNEIYQTAKTTLERTADGGYNVTSGNAEKVFAQARKIAADLIADANIREDNELFRQYEEPRKYLRETPIHYDRARMVAELGGEEEFKAWRDSMRGILNLTAKEGSGIPVDTVFDEFAEQWPGNVDLTVIQDTDRIQELARTAQYMREQERSNYVNPYAQNREEAEGQLAAAIYSEAVERLMQSEKPKQAKPRTQPKTTQTQRAEQTAPTRETASQTEETGDESVEEFRARIERMYEAGEITRAEYDESIATADEAESTGRGFTSSTVERDEGPVGKIPALIRNVRDRAAGRQYSISVDEDESRKNAKTALEYFGKTYSWRETGYITRDGDRIDFSGKRNGAPAGHRSMDHREISDALGDDYGDGTYSGAMVQFMREGNIRISPESGGINLMAEPTEQQYKQLEAFIQNNRGEVILDIDDEDGYTIESREYDHGTRSSRVLNDIRGYFEDGALPEEPDIRYSVSDADDEAYMDAVEAGDTETAQRMVDEAAREAGYLIRAFHGTPNGTFTVFRNWQYFTEDRSYADVYQKQGASSNGYKRTALNPKTYAVFIDPKNAFDTRNARDREIFENEFFGRYGNGAPLSERGLPDWTDGDDLIEFFEDNGYDYDTIYIDEGGTGGYEQEVNDRGISIVVKDSAQIKSADPVTYDDDGNVIPLSERFNPVQEDIRYSIVEDPDTLEFLDNQDTVKVYRAMQLIDGELYPPMAAKVEGKFVEPTRIGEWYQAEERPDLVKNGKFTLNKGNGTSIPAAYNPYFHSSASPLNDQFSSAYKRPNLVVVEGEIPASELTSGYRAEGAKDTVGETKWHAGPVASKLKGDKARRVFLSRWFKVDRVMPDAEVADIIADTLRGENVSIPSRVVTPSLLEALRERGVPIIDQGPDVRHSVSEANENPEEVRNVYGITRDDAREIQNIGRKNINNFTSEEIQKSQKWARKFWDEMHEKSPFFRAWFGDWRRGDTKTPVTVVRMGQSQYERNGRATNRDTDMIISYGKQVRGESKNHVRGEGASLDALGNIGEIIENAVYLDSETSIPNSKSKMPNTAFMHHFYTLYDNGDGIQLLKLYVEEALTNKNNEVFNRAYELKDIEKVAELSGSVHPANGSLTEDSRATDYSIADLCDLVNTYDAEYRPKPSSLVVNDDGTPKVMYHGTNADRDFHIFNTYGSNYGLYGAGSYFTDNPEVASSYAVNKGRGTRPRVYPVYLNIKNPMVMEEAADINLWLDALPELRDYIVDPETYEIKAQTNREFYRAMEQYFEDEGMYDYDAAESAMDVLQSMGYDGIRHVGGLARGDGNPHDVWIAFDPTQIKSATGNRGTFDPENGDIRYSLADTPEAAGPIYSLPAKARDDALRVENALASSLAKMFGVNARHTTDEYKAFRTEVARPIIEAMLEGREVDPDRIFSENWNGSSILEAQGAREGLDDALTEAWRRVQQINTFAQEKASEESARAARNAEIDARIPDTTEGIIKMGETFKDAKRRRSNVMARLLLTDEDLELARDVASGQMTEQEVYARRPFNYRDILEAAEAERAFRDADEVWGRYTRRIASRLIETADNLLEESDRWRDKGNGFAYARETAERNFRDVMGGDSGAMIDEYIRPIHKSEAESTRFKNDYIDRVKKLGLSRKIARGNQASESQAVQFLGEAEDNVRYLQSMRRSDAVRDGKTLDEWRAEIEAFRQANPNLDYNKVARGIAEFQAIYGELINEMNRVLVENGYLPVNVRRGYFPHFNGGDDGILSKFANLLGINIESQALPTAINGLTAGFKPGKAWFGHAQERTGFQTTYDAVEGFEGYIGGVSDVIHQTANIRRLRTLASRIRYRFGDEGIRNKINTIMANDTLDDHQKEVQINDLKTNGQYKLSRFVAWIDEYTNLLANKKSKYDRGIEDLMGRRIYTWMKNIEGRVAANMISANLGSALTNFIPLNQAGAMLGDASMLRGAFDTFAGRGRHDGFVNRSDFLTNRRGTDPLIQNRADKISEFLSSPMNIIDDFTSETIVRAAYGKYVRQGMDPDTAMQMADEFAAGVMADRSKGATPTIFSSHNPLTKLLTQFQVEVNNEFSTIFKDIPKGTHIPDREKKNMVAVAAWTLLRYFIGAYLFNDLYEKVVGRRAALDPIDILNDAVGDLTGKKLNNTIDALFTRDGIIEDVERKNPSDATQSLFENTAEELPFIGGLLGGGRIPISSAFPNFENINKAALNENWSTGKKAQVIGRELGGSIGTYIMPPFAGGAAKKVIQTAENTLTGGRYVKNAEGEDQIQYPYFTDTPLDTAGTVAKSLLFGPTATEGGRDWVEGGFGNQTAKVTNLYRTLTDNLGESQRTAWDLIQTISSGEYGRDAQAKRYAIAQSDLSDEGKAAAMETYMSESEGRKFRGANQFGVSADAWAALYAGMDEFDANGNSTYSQEEMRDALEGIRVPVSYGEGATQGLFGGSMDDRSLTNREKAVLWAAYGYKKNGKSWKQSNNPYDPDLGERVIDWIEGLVYDEDDEE